MPTLQTATTASSTYTNKILPVTPVVTIRERRDFKVDPKDINSI
jgi:hypothetical protein